MRFFDCTPMRRKRASLSGSGGNSMVTSAESSCVASPERHCSLGDIALAGSASTPASPEIFQASRPASETIAASSRAETGNS